METANKEVNQVRLRIPFALVAFSEQTRHELRIAKCAHLFFQRRGTQRFPDLVQHEGIERRGESLQDPGGSRRHLAAHVHAIRLGATDFFKHADPDLRVPIVLLDRQRKRPAGRFSHTANQGELLIEIPEVRDELDHALPGFPERSRDTPELFTLRLEARRVIARTISMLLGAGRGETEGSGLDCFLDQRRHAHRRRPAFAGSRARRTLMAVAPERTVRNLQTDVDRERRGRDGVHVLREGLPVPLNALGEGGARMSSTPSMSWMSQPWRSGAHGAKPTPQFPMTTVVTP